MDEDLSTLDICGTRVLAASVKDDSLNLIWAQKDFESWAELQTNQKYIDNKNACNDSLKAGREANGKGGGKGSNKGAF